MGRVAEYRSVEVTDTMTVERYSHVMHITSNVSGRLAPGRTAFDALQVCLPAGTVSGAPKVRAMEIIDELEPCRRGPYGGAVGYVASQPWPFPASLMIGCVAQALTREIVVDQQELEDARWFGREEVRSMFEGTHPLGISAPNPMAIAHHLLKFWLDGGAA